MTHALPANRRFCDYLDYCGLSSSYTSSLRQSQARIRESPLRGVKPSVRERLAEKLRSKGLPVPWMADAEEEGLLVSPQRGRVPSPGTREKEPDRAGPRNL